MKTFIRLQLGASIFTILAMNAFTQTTPIPMSTPERNADVKTWADLSGKEVKEKLASMGDHEDFLLIDKEVTKSQQKSGQPSVMTDAQFNIEYAMKMVAPSGGPKPYLYTYHAIGYVGSTPGTGGNLNIVSAGTITPDTSLRGKNIRITLNKLRVFDYPGGGRHNVLFDFSAQHQPTSAAPPETLHFNQTYKVNEQDEAGVTGRPIFSGLRVGPDGVFLSAFTVNVSNDDDERMLAFLEGDVFKQGLGLLNSVNPLVPIVSGFASGIAKGILSKNKDVAVQKFELGLDFNTTTPVGAKLREGTYIAVQAPQDWDWSKWQYDVNRGMFVSKQNVGAPVPFNYVVFNVSKATVTP